MVHTCNPAWQFTPVIQHIWTTWLRAVPAHITLIVGKRMAMMSKQYLHQCDVLVCGQHPAVPNRAAEEPHLLTAAHHLLSLGLGADFPEPLRSRMD